MPLFWLINRVSLSGKELKSILITFSLDLKNVMLKIYGSVSGRERESYEGN